MDEKKMDEIIRRNNGCANEVERDREGEREGVYVW